MAARQAARELAARLGFSATDLTLIATAVSEVTRNIVRFADCGEVVVELVEGPRRGVQVVARDSGPGIPDVARALTNAALIAWLQQDLGAAERKLAEALAWAGERDLVAMELFQRALQACMWVDQGRWIEAAAQAESVAGLPATIVPARIMALAGLGRARAQLGKDPWDALDEAYRLAQGTGEMQRLLPTTVARAEAAWLGGDLSRVAGEVLSDAGRARQCGRRCSGGTGPVLWPASHRQGSRTGPPTGCRPSSWSSRDCTPSRPSSAPGAPAAAAGSAAAIASTMPRCSTSAAARRSGAALLKRR